MRDVDLSVVRHIASFVSLLQEQMGESTDALALQYQNSIAKASKRMSLMIEGLLEYARLGRVAIESQPVPLSPLLHGVIAHLRLVIQAAARMGVPVVNMISHAHGWRWTFAIVGVLAVITMATLSFSWYSCVALVFSSAHMANLYSRSRKWLDRFVGGCYVLFGTHLVANR